MNLYFKKLVVYGLIAVVIIAAFLPILQGEEQTVEAQGSPPYQVTVDELMTHAQQMATASTGSPVVRPIPEEESVPFIKDQVNPASPLVAAYSRDGALAAPNITGPLATVALEGQNYTSLTLDDVIASSGTVIYPPDTMGVVGPTEFVTTLNGWFRSHDKNTGVVGALDVRDAVFWCPNPTDCVLTPTGGVIATVYPADPRVRYDRHTGRWFFIMIDVLLDSANNFAPVANRLLLAWTDGPSITGSTVITLAYFQQDQTLEDIADYDDGALLDYPTLGIDANALYIGGNMFFGQFGTNTSMWVIPKDSLLASGGGDISNIAYAFRNLVGNGGLWTPHAPDSFDPNQTTGWFLGVDFNFFGLLDVCEVTNPDFDPGLNTPSYSCTQLTIPNTNFPLDVPSPGGTALDALDDRLMMATLRDGSIWTTHNVGVDSTGASPVNFAQVDRTGSRWYEIDISQGLGSTSLIQAGTIYDSSANPLYYWIPSVHVSGQGHAVMGFSVGNTTTFPSAAWTNRLATDPLGTTNAMSIYQPGVAAYSGPDRWGDYSMTSLDPCDDMTLWTIQEFSDTPTNLSFDWAVQALEVIAPQPATAITAVPADVASGQASVSVTLTGDPATGGWYDQLASGAAVIDNCYTPLSVTLTNGVVVNGVQWIDADTIILDLDTTAATPGNPEITITNPDAQTSLSTCILSIDSVTDDVCAEPTEEPTDQPGEPGVSDPALSKIGILGPGQLGLPGEQITWVVTVNNTSGQDLTNVVITDTLIPELQIDGVTTTVGSASVSGQTVTVVIPFLSAGQSAEIQIATTVLSNPDASSFVNTATLTADNGFTATATASVPATGLPDTGYPPESE